MIVATLLAKIFASVYTLTTIFDFELGKKSCFRFLWGPIEWGQNSFFSFFLFTQVITYLCCIVKIRVGFALLVSKHAATNFQHTLSMRQQIFRALQECSSKLLAHSNVRFLVLCHFSLSMRQYCTFLALSKHRTTNCQHTLSIRQQIACAV